MMLRLRTLGALDLRDGEGRPNAALLAQPKRTALLVYLALASPRGLHRRDALLPIFWPEQDEQHARNALSQAIHFLRRVVGADVIVTRTSEELGIAADHFWCDAIAFDEAVAAGRMDAAVELYAGPLLDGFHIADAPEFGRWQEAERARLAGRYAAAVESLALSREKAGDFGAAAAEWRRLAQLDPYCARTALRLMRALADSGDAAGAIRHAYVHETLLREELSLPVDAQITGLVEELRTGTVNGRSSRSAADESGWTVARDGGEVGERRPADTEGRHHPAPPHLPSPEGDSARSGRASGRSSRRRVVSTAATVVVAAGALMGVALLGRAEQHGAATIRSLAVLPLDNLSADSTQLPLVDGIHDALITELGRYPDLRVISRTSVLGYREERKAMPEIADELGVDGLVEGAVLRDGDRVSIRVQLVHGSTDAHRWARRYERDLDDMLTMQAELAEDIAQELRVATRPAVENARLRVRTDSTEREMYLRDLLFRGRLSEITRSHLGMLAARQAYERAIQRDSTFAPAYAGMARVYTLLSDYDYGPIAASLDSARLMARRAMALDSMLPGARTAFAITLANDLRFADSEREFRRAIELNPSNPGARYWYSVLLVGLGRGEEAMHEAKRAEALDRFAPRGVVAMQRYATFLITGHRPYRKIPVRQRPHPTLAVEPGEPWAIAADAIDLAAQGDCAAALKELRRAKGLVNEGNARMMIMAVPVYVDCGMRAEARAEMDAVKRRPDAADIGYRVAMASVVLGEPDSALVWLERHRWAIGQLSGLSADERLDPLRSDPRFQDFLRRLGLR